MQHSHRHLRAAKVLGRVERVSLLAVSLVCSCTKPAIAWFLHCRRPVPKTPPQSYDCIPQSIVFHRRQFWARTLRSLYSRFGRGLGRCTRTWKLGYRRLRKINPSNGCRRFNQHGLMHFRLNRSTGMPLVLASFSHVPGPETEHAKHAARHPGLPLRRFFRDVFPCSLLLLSRPVQYPPLSCSISTAS